MSSSRVSAAMILAALTASAGGCGAAPDCRMATLTAHADADGDGFGDPATARRVCTIEAGFVENSGDCDDTRPEVFTGAGDVCDGIDNDCDQVVDDELAEDWWPDADGDGRADDLVAPTRTCAPPEGWVQVQGDCDDSDAAVFGDAEEICDGKDNDCDDRVDADDPGIALPTWYRDRDEDGYGDVDWSVALCDQPERTIRVGGDCDDGDAEVHPGAPELCDDVDNDCDGLEDDDDPLVDPAALRAWYLDADDDDLGDPAVSASACTRPDDHVTNDDDCDDGDDQIRDATDWYGDADHDGFGGGAPVEVDVCFPTDPALVKEEVGLDCDDGDNRISPDALETCGDGVDDDCDGEDAACPLPTDCLAWQTLDPDAPSGVYEIEPTIGVIDEVWCDMDTDGGGWTLVGASRTQPLSDRSGPHHDDLVRLDPTGIHPGIWGGLRPVTQGAPADVRFACKVALTDAEMAVDFSVYEVGWYDEFTAGTDTMSCFSEDDGAGYEAPAPSRRDNLRGILLPLGDDWDAGFLEGEDSCSDTDFTVDFDDRGKDGDESDGTDWGADDAVAKCGVAGQGDAWFLFVRPR